SAHSSLGRSVLPSVSAEINIFPRNFDDENLSRNITYRDQFSRVATSLSVLRLIIPTRLLRLAEALVFASPRPATWRLLAPFLPAHLRRASGCLGCLATDGRRGVNLTG